MSTKPILLFLHGVGTGDPKGGWKSALSASLSRLGYPDLEDVRVIAPRFAHALRGADESEKLPPLTVNQPSGEGAKKNRREFERRTGAVEYRLGYQDPGKGIPGSEALLDFGLALPFFEQARNYLQDPEIRAQVLNRILSKLPHDGRVVILGHSLGSVIAADLLRRLHKGLHVVGMVTVGSPLASDSFGVDKLRDVLREPPPNLEWWVSFWDGRDPVAARRGVSSAFPWMIDFRVPSRTMSPLAAHQAVDYLAQDVVAEAVGYGLFGSRSKEVARVERGVDVPLDAAEDYALLALRYAHLIKLRLTGDRKERYAGALRNVHANLVDVLAAKRSETARPLPEALSRLRFDLSDPRAEVPEPTPSRRLAKDDAVVMLTVLMGQNIILPYEVNVPADVKQKAMEDLTAEMGLGGVFGSDVFAAAREAQAALNGGRGVNWLKWGALGAGAIAIVVATGGLALAAAPGVAGAAAITSALAAFGPGGMIGGLLTAGTLVTAGGGGIAFGLVSASTTAETLEAVVSGQLTAEILRKRHALDSDAAVWRNLVDMEMQLRREHERLDEFSDDSAPSIKELKRKVDAVERALAHLRHMGLEPAASAPSSEVPSDDRPFWKRAVPAIGR